MGPPSKYGSWALRMLQFGGSPIPPGFLSDPSKLFSATEQALAKETSPCLWGKASMSSPTLCLRGCLKLQDELLALVTPSLENETRPALGPGPGFLLIMWSEGVASHCPVGLYNSNISSLDICFLFGNVSSSFSRCSHLHLGPLPLQH